MSKKNDLPVVIAKIQQRLKDDPERAEQIIQGPEFIEAFPTQEEQDQARVLLLIARTVPNPYTAALIADLAFS